MNHSGARRFHSLAVAIVLTVGTALSGATQTLARPPMSISGRIVSAATGRPIPGARANVSIADYGVATTIDADGRFVATVREPGVHRVSASAPGYLTRAFGYEPEIGGTPVALKAGQHVTDIDIRLHRGATIAGVVTDDVKEPVVSGTVRAFAKRMTPTGETPFGSAGETKTDDRGEYRLTGLAPGQYVIGVVDRTNVMLAPSAISTSAATLVTLAGDAERSGVNVQLRAVKTGALEGTVTGAGAAAPRVTVQLMPDSELAAFAPRVAQPVIGGRFAFADVPAGRYYLVVTSGLNEPSRAWEMTPVVVEAGRTARANVTVSDQPRISGTVESVGIRQLSISLRPIDRTRPSASPSSVRTGASGPFEIPGVAPGRYQIVAGPGQGDLLPQSRLPRLEEPGTHRLITSVFVKGEDLSDRVFVVGAKTSIDDMRVVVTETAARISGTVLDASGKPTTVGAVVVVASDAQYWTPVSRRIRMTRADTDGVFHVPLLPPGRYRVAHVMSLAPGQLWDPAFLKTLAGARDVTVAAREVSSVEMRLK